MLWVDTARTQEEKSFHTGSVRLMDHLSLNEQILVDKFSRMSGIRKNPANFGCTEENIFGTLS
jgi:hypothetical protein